MIQKSNISFFLLGLFFVSFDAYTIFNIPIPWIGQALLFFWVILNFKQMEIPSKSILLIFFVLLPGSLTTFFNIYKIDILYVSLRLFNIVSFLFLFFYFSKIQDLKFLDKLNKSIKTLLVLVSVTVIYIFLAQIG